jgi:catechol 2,3-dioxygenase
MRYLLPLAVLVIAVVWLSGLSFEFKSVPAWTPQDLAEMRTRALSFSDAYCLRVKEDGKRSIHPDVRIGHVHLKVADLERAIKFYRDVLGFELTQRMGDSAAFLSAGGYHHHIGLNTWHSKDGARPARNATGLYHVAIVYPTRGELADALQRLIAAEVPITGASDHGVSEAIYLNDPDGNGVELYWDKPRDQWPMTPAGNLQMVSEPLDLEELLNSSDRKP